MTPLLVSIILLQFVPFTTCKTVELTCPALSAPISRRRLPSKKHSDSLDSSEKHQSHSSDSSKKHKSDSLDSSCFELNITINVENILPDPTYILPQDNINAISDGIEQTISDCSITIESNEIDISNEWIIDNQCNEYRSEPIDHKEFVTREYITSCDDDTLLIDESYGTIQCELTLPESVVYVWDVEQINLSMDIISCSAIVMQAVVSETDDYTEFIAVSQTVTIQEEDPSGLRYQFIFTNNTLQQNLTYFILFEIVEVLGKKDSLSDKFQFENVCIPEIITISKANSCTLGKWVAVTGGMQWSLAALCNESLAQPEEELFASVLFQKHSSQNHIPGYIWDNLEQRRRHLLQPGESEGGGGPGDARKSLDVILSDGTIVKVANDEIFPFLDQCVAFDAETRRVFSVGGNDENGNAMDRLAVYYLESKSSAVLLDDFNLKLDKPRAMTTCYYYKRNEEEEYMVVINGMNHTKYVNEPEYWYNDMVFIPLDVSKSCDIPIVELKFNLIDMTTYITENDILYLIGGRNGQNATNVVQIIDLDQVFDAGDSSSDSSLYAAKNNKKVTTLTTYERMAPMKLKRSLPRTDFTFINNKTCMLTWNGQNYIDGKWVTINNEETQLQMYCNELLTGNYYTPKKEIEFTDYDNDNLLTGNNYKVNMEYLSMQDRVMMYHYDFENDGLWYGFSAQFEICFDDKNEMQDKINFFSEFTDDNRQILEENILIESQKNYRDWSYGFGEVDIVNIGIIEPTPCSSDSEEPKHSNRKNLRTRKSANANMFHKINDQDYYQTNEYYQQNMWKTIIAFVLCVMFLLWLLVVCIWKKKQNAYV